LCILEQQFVRGVRMNLLALALTSGCIELRAAWPPRALLHRGQTDVE
jgi:hypothetical protein